MFFFQQCFTDFYVTEQGFVYYDLGCRIEDVRLLHETMFTYSSKMKTENNSSKLKTRSTFSNIYLLQTCTVLNGRKRAIPKPAKRQFENLHLCEECCSTDFCNRQGCPDNSELNLIEYNYFIHGSTCVVHSLLTMILIQWENVHVIARANEMETISKVYIKHKIWYKFVHIVAVNLVNNTVCFNCPDAANPGTCVKADVCNYDEVWLLMISLKAQKVSKHSSPSMPHSMFIFFL